MRQTGFRIIALLVLLCGLVGTGFASANDSVRISVARAGWYDVEQQLFVGEGNVQIETEDIFISGDYVEWHIEREELLVTGNVVFRQGEDELVGEALTYNVAHGRGEFLDVKTLVEAAKAESPIFLSAEKMIVEGTGYHLINGRITTCDLDEAHFHLAVREMEVLPNDKLIIRGVTYYEKSLPLFYWPYLIIPLDNSLEELLLALPVIGYSASEGYYMKNTFDYYFSENAYGSVNLDLFSKLGLGYGVTHNYALGVFGSGKIRAYHIPFTENSRFSAGLDHEWSRGPWRFVTTNSLDDKPTGRSIDLRSRLSLNTGTIAAEVNGTFLENVGTRKGQYWEYGGSWRQQLGTGLRLNLNGNVTGQTTTTVVRMVNYLAETTYSYKNHAWALAVEQRYNPDLLDDNVDKPTWRSVNRVPELTWRISNPSLMANVLPLRIDLAAGHYHEFPSDVADWRLKGSVSLLTRTWRPTSSTSVSYSGELAASHYGSGYDQQVFSGRVNLTQQLGQSLRLNARLNEQMVWGETPFRFDAANPVRSLNLQLSQSGARFSWSARTSYDFIRERYSTLALQGSWRPTDQIRLSMSAGYDLNRRVFGQVVPMVEYSAKDELERSTTLRIGGRYHVEKAEWERVDLQVQTPIGQTWSIGYDAVYEPSTGSFKKGQISIEKDLHCRSVTLAYDHVRQNVAFSFTINAFPTLPFKWGSDTGVSLFDLDDVYDLIGVEE